MVNKLFSSSAVEALDPISLQGDETLTFSISGDGTVQMEIKITDHSSAVWKVVQVCADGVVYSSNSGARSMRFNQTVADGATIMEVSGARL